MEPEVKNYKCPEDGATWGGVVGEVEDVCPDCGTEGVEQVDEAPEGTTGATGEADGGPVVDEPADAVEVETATYKITGLVDIFDEQHNITGQFPVGSEQVLPVEMGDRAVEAGQAERVE